MYMQNTCFSLGNTRDSRQRQPWIGSNDLVVDFVALLEFLSSDLNMYFVNMRYMSRFAPK